MFSGAAGLLEMPWSVYNVIEVSVIVQERGSSTLRHSSNPDTLNLVNSSDLIVIV